MKHSKHLQKGFSLVEMAIYMVIFSVLMLILMQIFFSALDVQQESKSTSSVDQDGIYIIQRLTYDIQRSTSVFTPSSYGVAGSSLQIQIGGVNYTYSVDGSGNLKLTNDQGTNVLNTPDTTVSNMKFTRLGSVGGKSTIIVSFNSISTTSRTTGKETRSYSTSITQR